MGAISALAMLAAASQLPVITESMANPVDETTGEYVEIHNPSPSPCPLTGFSITDGDALDQLLPWKESLYGPFPGQGLVTGTDTIPPWGFALLFELDYPSGPLLDIADGAVILTTGDHSVCNGLAASSDPLTLFGPGGTACSDVVSTYGTPVDSDYWGDRDDDGLDSIPWDPGEGCAVERLHACLPDMQGSWVPTGPGGTPGWLPCYPDTIDLAVTSVWSLPSPPLPGEPCILGATVTNGGSVTVWGAGITLFLDSDADSFPGPGEVLALGTSDTLHPGFCDTLSVPAVLDDGNYLLAASVSYPEDQVPSNDIGMTGIVCGQGTYPVISEVLCSPYDQDTGEYIELYFPGPGVYDLTGCGFTDGDALDVVVPWDPDDPLADPDARCSPWMPAGSWALILDSEYTSGSQPYQLPPLTVVLTTANTTLGDGLSGGDPVTFYRPGGTGRDDIVSTYGTPVCSGDPLQCDDDGLDSIPYDPGTGNSVHRLDLEGPDQAGNWFDSDAGPTPGGPPPDIQTGTDASPVALVTTPPAGPPGGPVCVLGVLGNTGTEPIPPGALTAVLWADLDGDGTPSPGETIIEHTFADTLQPCDSACVECLWQPPAGPAGVFALSCCPSDSFPGNDTLAIVWSPPPGLVINEVMYSPSPGQPEWIELLNGLPCPVDLSSIEFRDSASGTLLSDSSAVLAPGGYAVACPDTSAFVSVWGSPGCLLCQPGSWPALNNSTQPGQCWADLLGLADGLQVLDYVPYDDDWGGGGNVSLERLGQGLPGYLPSSWSGSPPGGTPGEANSSSQGGQTGAFLSFSPDPFSPDGDGTGDVLLITVNSGFPAALITVTVYDVCGRTVRELASEEVPGGCLAVPWDGTGSGGERLPVGRYVVYAGARSQAGQVREDCAVAVLARRL
jgi:hypothetical protein